jgi:hypothetical protein
MDRHGTRLLEVELNVPLVIAGGLSLVGAAVHGLGGELLVVRKLSAATLPASSLGGPRTTKSMIHVTWHLTTTAFLVTGAALIVSGAALAGAKARAVGVVGAGATTGFAALTLTMGAAYAGSPRALLRHPAPLILSAAAALAWVGVL